MNKSRMGILLFLAICFSGCVANQSIFQEYNPEPYTSGTLKGKVMLDVVDERPFVKNGDKDSSYIGHFRGGYGNTWGVKTRGNVPLAEQIAEDLSKELNALGFKVEKGGGDRLLQISILDYNFDTYINGRFWYDIKISVFDNNKTLLAQDELKKEHTIKGSFWVGPVFAFKRELPVYYQTIIKGLVRDNEAIRKALTS